MDSGLLFLMLSLSIFFMACGGSNQSEVIQEESGELAFSLHWQMPADDSPATASLRKGVDIVPCQEFGIDSVRIVVLNSNEEKILTRDWECLHTQGRLANIPSDQEIRLVVEGYASRSLQWRGESGPVYIEEGETTQVKRITITRLGQDKAPPIISAVFPEKGDTKVALNSSLAIHFSEPVDPDTAFEDSIYISHGGEKISSQVSYYTGSDIVILTPFADLSPETTYTVHAGSGIVDLVGNEMSKSYTWHFTTGSRLDDSPPKVIALSPNDQETGVPTDSSITLMFNENLLPTSVNETTFFLTSGGAAIEGRITCTGQKASFTPLTRLSANTTYQAVITTVVEDLCGNSLENDYAWQFTTGADLYSALTLSTLDR